MNKQVKLNTQLLNVVDRYNTYTKELEMLDKLLSKGADVNAQTLDDSTLLHLAADDNDIWLVKALLEHGADKTLKDEQGRTAYDVAERCQYDAIKRALSK